MDSIKIGNYLASLRKAHGWTQSELAGKLNVSDKTISKWEGGNGLPDITIVPALAKILGVTTDELLAGESKKSSADESIFAKIASGDLDLSEQIEKGLKIDGFDEYGKSLADYCAEKNNIEVFRLLISQNKVVIANKTETRSNMNMRPSGKETLTFEDVLLYDRAYCTGNRDNPYPKDYNDSALFCLLIKNRADDLLQQLNLEKRAFTADEADCIANDFDYFYKNYFVQNFPSHIGVLICALIKRGKKKEAQKMLALISEYKQKIEKKRAECEREQNRCGKSNPWTINWNTGLIHEPVYDKVLKKYVIMRDKIMAYVWGLNVRPFLIGNAILFTQEDLVEIGFADSDFLAECRKLEYAPDIDHALLARLLEKDDLKLFCDFTADEALSVELEKLILNSNGKIKAAYVKKNTPKNINDVIATDDVELVMSMLSTSQATSQFSKEIQLELLGSGKMLPVLKQIVPFLSTEQLDALLNNHIDKDNIQARLFLIEAGAKILTQYTIPDYEGGTFSEWKRDDLQTEILYRVLKAETKK